MNYAIKVTNTWTKKESLFPVLFKDEREAKDNRTKLEDKCSLTGKFKNNEYSVIVILN